MYNGVCDKSHNRRNEMCITLEELKNAVQDIKQDDEWVKLTPPFGTESDTASK